MALKREAASARRLRVSAQTSATSAHCSIGLPPAHVLHRGYGGVHVIRLEATKVVNIRAASVADVDAIPVCMDSIG